MSNKEKPPRIRLSIEEYELIQGIREQAVEHKIGIKHVPMGWMKGAKSSFMFKNPMYKPELEESEGIDFNSIIKTIVASPFDRHEREKNIALLSGFFDRLVYTDVHIGMEVNPNGAGLYGGVWNKDEVLRRRDLMANHVLDTQESGILYIDELGDFVDGWNGQTVRKGHDLPQNMTNQEAYDVAVEFKVGLLQQLAPYFKKIYCRNICKDNHSGDFGYVVNSAVKRISEMMFPSKVSVYNQLKFIEHYIVGNKFAFVTTHGKDDINLKTGFKPHLKPQDREKIDVYMIQNNLMRNSLDFEVEFSKGDTHIYLFDSSTSLHFNYYNYPAFSPPSDWVQTNFKPTRSGFVSFNYRDGKDKSINEYMFR